MKKPEKTIKEREKELRCIYAFSDIVDKTNTIKEICTGLLKILPPAMQYPKIACARIIINGNEFKTSNFKKTKWNARAKIRRPEKKEGSIEIHYLKKRPFLKEETKLLNAIAERLGRIIERIKAEEELKAGEEKYRLLYETSADAIMTLSPPKWKFTSGNPATIKMFRCKNEKDFTSRAPYELSPPKQPDGKQSSKKALQMINEAVKKGHCFFEWTHRRADGEDFSATVLLTRVTIGGETFLQATVRDMSAQKKAEDALKEKTIDLEKAFNDLKKKEAKLEKFTKFAVGRELRMVELKKKLKMMKKGEK